MRVLIDLFLHVSAALCSEARARASLTQLRQLVAIALLMLSGLTTSYANTCSPAASAGAAASDWSTYCWLDFTGYNDASVRGGGQAFSFSLNDGSTLTLTLKATSTAGTALSAVAAPSWSGAALGNSSFIGVPGSPVLYTSNNGSTVTVTLNNIQVTPPGGVAATSGWAIVAADAESTNTGESIVFTTNGAGWVQLPNIPPISGAIYPTLSGVGSVTVTESGVGGTVGGYIFSSSNSPTVVSSKMVASGLQGVMFAVRYAWVSVNKSINGTRLNTNDQFKYAVTATSGGTQLVTKTTSGASSGPFTAAQVTVSAGYPVTLTETMAAGSVSVLSAYSPSLTCTNANSGSSTVMPTAAAVTSINLGTLAYGDGVTCIFTNTPKRPALNISKISDVLSDPVNLGSNPKRIPGAVIRYIVTVTNTGPGTVDASTLVMTDPVPANTALCVSTLCGNPIVEFIDGTPTSALSFNYAANVTYSKAAGGVAPFTYTPVADAAGFDATVTGIRIAPTGIMAAAGSGNPGFVIRFRVKVN